MARLRFRVSGIQLDEEEDVAAITAVVRDDTLAIVRAIVPRVAVADIRRGGTEMVITISAPDVVKLFGECGRIRGTDQRSEHTSQIYDRHRPRLLRADGGLTAVSMRDQVECQSHHRFRLHRRFPRAVARKLTRRTAPEGGDDA